MGEVEPLADAVQNTAPHELLQRLRGVMLLEARRATEEGKVELPSDDGGDGRQIAAALAQRFQMPGNELANSLRDGELRRWAGHEPFRKRAHGFDDRERVALADDPDLFRESGQHRLVALRPGKRSDQRERLFLGERRQPQLDETLAAGEIFEHPAQDRRAGQVLLAGGTHHEEGPRLKPTPEERQETETHLVAPVEVLEDQHRRSVQDEMSDELRHALEESGGSPPDLGWAGARERRAREGGASAPSATGIEALENLLLGIDAAGAKRVDPRGERQDLLGLVAASHEHAAPARNSLSGDLGQQATLADARLADQCRDVAVPVPRPVQSLP